MKKAICIAGILVVIGILVGIIGLAGVGFDLTKLGGEAVVTEEYTFAVGEVQRIEVDVDTMDVVIAESSNPGEDIRVFVKKYESRTSTAAVKDGKLTVEDGERPWYRHIGIFWASESVEIVLPYGYSPDSIGIDTDTGDTEVRGVDAQNMKLSTDTGRICVKDGVIDNLRIEGDTGDVSVLGITAAIVEVKTDTGDVDVGNVIATDRIKTSCDTGDASLRACEAPTVEARTTTGDVEMTEVIAGLRIAIECSTGDVDLDRCDGAAIDVTTSTGEVEMLLLSPKVFDVDSSTGKKRIPLSGEGGICKVRTSTGDIEIKIAE